MTAEQQEVKPCGIWIIAMEYFDGPMAGVAYKIDAKNWIFFRVVGWDSEQWSKVYATTSISTEAASILLSALRNVEQIVEPLWIPRYAQEDAKIIEAWNSIFAEVQKAAGWTLSESRDLFHIESELLLPADLSLALVSDIINASRIDLGTPPILSNFVNYLRKRSR